jgi:Mn-dependent DtxR family transcriptional regulator
MTLVDDYPNSGERAILELYLRLGSRSLTRSSIAEELNADEGRLTQQLLRLASRGWLRPTGTRAVWWQLTNEGREELRRRASA